MVIKQLNLLCGAADDVAEMFAVIKVSNFLALKKALSAFELTK